MQADMKRELLKVAGIRSPVRDRITTLPPQLPGVIHHDLDQHRHDVAQDRGAVAPVSKATHRNTKRPSSYSQRSARSSQLKRAVDPQGQKLRPALALGALAGLEFGWGFGHAGLLADLG